MTPPFVRPRHLFIANKKVHIRHGVPAGVLVAKALEDQLLSPYAKSRVILSILYPRPIPPQLQTSALEMALAFFQGRSSPDTNVPAVAAAVRRQSPPSDANKALFSLWHDLPVICASFLAVYGFHPFQRLIHWWDFLTLLMSLPADSPFLQLLIRRQATAADPKPASPEAERVLARLRQGLPPDDGFAPPPQVVHDA